jgi:hypothetical protein
VSLKHVASAAETVILAASNLSATGAESTVGKS